MDKVALLAFTSYVIAFLVGVSVLATVITERAILSDPKPDVAYSPSRMPIDLGLWRDLQRTYGSTPAATLDVKYSRDQADTRRTAEDALSHARHAEDYARQTKQDLEQWNKVIGDGDPLKKTSVLFLSEQISSLRTDVSSGKELTRELLNAEDKKIDGVQSGINTRFTHLEWMIGIGVTLLSTGGAAGSIRPLLDRFSRKPAGEAAQASEQHAKPAPPPAA